MFNKSLDDVKIYFKDHIHNKKLKKAPLPDTLEANFNIAFNWAKSTPSAKADNPTTLRLRLKSG